MTNLHPITRPNVASAVAFDGNGRYAVSVRRRPRF